MPRSPHVSQTRVRAPLIASCLVALAASSIAPDANAATSLRATLVEPKSIKLDGIPKEWPADMVRLSTAVKGKLSKSDLDAQALIAYDQSSLYIAADVTDDTVRSGADHLRLALGFPGGTVHEVAIYPGDPGKTPGRAQFINGKAISGSKVVEALRSGGYTLEASIPWSAFPQASTLRVGLRAALFAYDADASTAVETIAGTASSSAYSTLRSLATEAEQALADGLLKSKNIRNAPAFNLIADVVGNALKERVLVYDRYLVVLGPGFRKGSQYYYNDLEADASAGMVPVCETRDLTGDGQSDIILRKRFGSGGRYREMIQVLQFGNSDTPQIIFQHEVAIVTEKGSVINDIAFVNDGTKKSIRVTPGLAKGYHAGNYAEATETTFDPVLLPWASIKSQLYQFNGSAFAKSSQESQASTAPPATPQSTPSAQTNAPKPSSAQLLEHVYTQYKRDRATTGYPRFDLSADVTGDRQAERVILHDRDIVIWGKNFKSGTGYTYVTLTQFAAPIDIKEVTTRDVTGDGKAEILVKGLVRSNGPKIANGNVSREIFLVFQVSGDIVQRVFAAEIGRSVGNNKIVGGLNFISSGKSFLIELAPGRAINWSQQTYPFNQDTSPVGGVEPLLLPWGASAVRYKWNGSSFVR